MYEENRFTGWVITPEGEKRPINDEAIRTINVTDRFRKDGKKSKIYPYDPSDPNGEKIPTGADGGFTERLTGEMNKRKSAETKASQAEARIKQLEQELALLKQKEGTKKTTNNAKNS